MNIKGIKYGVLTNEYFPKFVQLYKDFYVETEKKEPDQKWMDVFLIYTLTQMKIPDSLYLLALRGKRVVGFLVLNPMGSIIGEKNILVNGIYVVPEYRDKGVGQMLIEIGKQWCKKNNVNNIFLFENIDTTIWSRKRKLGFVLFKKILKMEV